MPRNDVPRQELLGEWFAEWTSDPPVYGQATEFLAELISKDPGRAWAFILELVAHAPNDDALDWIGAGPLEDLLCDHGPAFIDRVEELAAKDQRFRSALASVRGDVRMDSPTRPRLGAIARDAGR